jgi:hypothetical protein
VSAAAAADLHVDLLMVMLVLLLLDAAVLRLVLLMLPRTHGQHVDHTTHRRWMPFAQMGQGSTSSVLAPALLQLCAEYVR